MPKSDDIIFTPALQWSGALRRKLSASPDFQGWLAGAVAESVTRARIHAWFESLDAGAGTPEDMGRMLRQLREQVFFCLMLRDIGGLASVAEVMSATTHLAELAIAHAYAVTARRLARLHGVPRDARGLPLEMLVIGMGKLGGRELNVSSDIDLVMLYASEGSTAGPEPLSHAQFFQRVTRDMVALLSEQDVHGFVFRCDLRLRPDGDVGPLAWSLPALEHYLLRQGREWERYAWLKARVIACQAFPDSRPQDHARQFEALRRPFVYRKYLDFDALTALRQLRERIRQDWERRALARPSGDTARNIKLGEGGIREIEFIVQLNQLIRGGRQPSLQRRNLHAALLHQQKAGVLPALLARGLDEAYFFLRRLEHMLQYREDAQTHILPREPGQRAALASALGMAADRFEEQLGAHRLFVSRHFRDAFRIAGFAKNAHEKQPDLSGPATDALHAQARTLFGTEAGPVCHQLDGLLGSTRVKHLPEASRARLHRLLPTLLEAAAAQSAPATTALRLLDLLAHIVTRSAYLTLLEEFPDTLPRAARILAASPWAAQYLMQFPLLLDSLVQWTALMQPPDLARLAGRLRADLDACLLPDGTPDMEQQMNLMRDVQHQVSFQLLAQDLDGRLSVETLADHLSALADLMLEETIRRVWPLVQDPPAPPPGALRPARFAVIAYGKLGGKELGYASDLDLVFLYDDPQADASERYARLARRISSWLSTLTSSGRLYDVDLRLRPDGDAGLLAVSISAFEQYQKEHAWSWEHQAITRARFAAGDASIGARFEALRTHILLMPRDARQLRQDVRTMRERISAGHPNRSGDFDLKHDRGGMVDVEFINQYLVLAHAREHPQLRDNLGNIALLRLAGEAGLIPPEAARAVADAYRSFRRHQHALRLQGAERARAPADSLTHERQAVLGLWHRVLGSEPAPGTH